LTAENSRDEDADKEVAPTTRAERPDPGKGMKFSRPDPGKDMMSRRVADDVVEFSREDDSEASP